MWMCEFVCVCNITYGIFFSSPLELCLSSFIHSFIHLAAHLVRASARICGTHWVAFDDRTHTNTLSLAVSVSLYGLCSVHTTKHYLCVKKGVIFGMRPKKKYYYYWKSMRNLVHMENSIKWTTF